MAPTTANCFSNIGKPEALIFDNGRLKQATYDTSQGFGFAPSRVRPWVARMPPMFRKRRSSALRMQYGG